MTLWHENVFRVIGLLWEKSTSQMVSNTELSYSRWCWLNKLLNKQSKCRWLDTVWRWSDVSKMAPLLLVLTKWFISGYSIKGFHKIRYSVMVAQLYINLHIWHQDLQYIHRKPGSSCSLSVFRITMVTSYATVDKRSLHRSRSSLLTHCGLVTPYGDTYLGQHRPR